MFLVEVVPAVIYGVLALTIPESPRYLIARGEMKKAKEVLSRYVGGDVEKVSTDILKTVEGKSDRPRFAILRRGKFGLLPIVWIGIGLSVLQQFTGINVIFYYSTTLWQAVGFTEQDSLTITVITSVTNILTTIVAIMLIDKVGRRPLLLVGAIGQFLCLAVLTLMFATATVVDGEPVLEGSAGTIALVAANLYVVFFGATWGPVVWVLLGEMFSNKIRAVALSVAACSPVGGELRHLDHVPRAGRGGSRPRLRRVHVLRVRGDLLRPQVRQRDEGPHPGVDERGADTGG